jgi:maltooligosyltrehalose trehalohydrolase
VLPERRVRFSVWAPHCRQVAVALSDRKGERSLSLESQGAGLFTGVLDDVDPGSDYSYHLDQGRPRPDPVSRYRPAGVHGPSRIVDPADFNWSDQGWTGVATADLIIYELHVGTFTPGGTFDSAIERLPILRQLGITAIEIMPVAEFPGSRNWGYDGVSLYAPQSTYGGPDGLRRLVNASHTEGLAVILDVVYNHLGPEGNYLAEFGPYFSDRHRTAWGDGWNLDGPGSDEVRRYIVDNALYWITEFHLDGLRLDAADKIVDQSALHILEEIVSAVRHQRRALGRRINLIAESDANDPRFIQTLDRGGYGLDAQWTDDFHHAVHVALTGEQQGYFQDFRGIGTVAKALTNRFVNDGRHSPYRHRRYGRSASHLPSDRFVVCIQNHDQVGNRATGQRLSTLVPPEALRLGAAVLLLSPYVPLLFMGEEYGEVNPFLYFVSHGDRALIEAVREGRRRELAGFGWALDVPDPQSDATFTQSRLDWSRVVVPAHAQLRALYTDLLSLRRKERALRPAAASISVSHDDADRWIRVEFSVPGSELVAAFNFADQARTLSLLQPAALMLSTDDPKYGGRGGIRLAPAEVTIPPLSAALLAKSRA